VRSATVGASRAARDAGYSPAASPTSNEAPSPATIGTGDRTAATPATAAYASVAPTPSTAPARAPSRHSSVDSVRNSRPTATRVAPSARRRPISPPAFEHRQHHHVGHPDAADEQGDPTQPERERGQRSPGGDPGDEQVGRVADVDRTRIGRVRGARQQPLYRRHPVRVGTQVHPRRRTVEAEQVRGGRFADERGGVHLGSQRHGGQHAQHGGVPAVRAVRGTQERLGTAG
jgi:hypothetical protein